MTDLPENRPGFVAHFRKEDLAKLNYCSNISQHTRWIVLKETLKIIFVWSCGKTHQIQIKQTKKNSCKQKRANREITGMQVIMGIDNKMLMACNQWCPNDPDHDLITRTCPPFRVWQPLLLERSIFYFLSSTFSSQVIRYCCFVMHLSRMIQTHKVEVALVKFRCTKHHRGRNSLGECHACDAASNPDPFFVEMRFRGTWQNGSMWRFWNENWLHFHLRKSRKGCMFQRTTQSSVWSSERHF